MPEERKETMAKEFYTERDIEDLFKRGILSLKVDENVILTELAYEKAKRLDMQLIRSQADTPPSAPIRPYLSKQFVQLPDPEKVPPPAGQTRVDLKERIRAAVQVRLGDKVDPSLLDAIIQRVLNSTGVK
jgi:hypothetical protein